MTAVMEEAEVRKSSKRSKYRPTPEATDPSGDILDDIGAGPQTLFCKTEKTGDLFASQRG